MNKSKIFLEARSLVLVAVCVALSSTLRPSLQASAQGAPPSADASYESGQKLYKEGHYQQAIAAFQTAIKGSKGTSTILPSLYYYIGSCYLQLKNNAQARQYFTFVRDHFPASRESGLAKSIVGGSDSASTTTATSSHSSSASPTVAVVSSSVPASSAQDLSGLPDENRFYFKEGVNGHMEVQAYLNDKPITCWFDTGASAHFGLNNLRDAGIPGPNGPANTTVSGWAGKSVPAWNIPCRLRLGNMQRKINATIEEELKMPPLIGQDFLEGYTYEIDHGGGFVTMKKNLTSSSTSNNLYDLPCTHTGDRDFVTIQVNGRDFPIMIDTGASRTIFEPTALAKIGVQVSDDLPTIAMQGVGGNISMRETTLQIRMGPINRTIPVLIGRAGGPSAIGQDVLGGNRFTIDSQKHLLRFFH